MLERDLFKVQTKCRRLEAQMKQLQELNTLNANNSNNTSSKFTLPSEFKEKWNELVTELIMDAFPDFLDKFHILIPLIHELFLVIREQVEGRERQAIEDVAKVLNLNSADGNPPQQIYDLLYQKLRGVFQEHSANVFDMDKSLVRNQTGHAAKTGEEDSADGD